MRSFFGPNHPKVALRSCILGDLLRDLGGLTKVRSHYRRALQIIESSYCLTNLDATLILNNLGNTARSQRDLRKRGHSLPGSLDYFAINWVKIILAPY